jgi:uncharacterized integral membrane protein
MDWTRSATNAARWPSRAASLKSAANGRPIMQFLRTTLWVAIAVILAIVASHNWHDVTLGLWGNIEVDIKIPVLLILVFLIGFLPPFLVLRARLWQMRRRLDSLERTHATPAPAPSFQPEDPDSL